LQVLGALLERPGEMVTREELRSKLWPADTFVDFDHSLNAAIKRLRDALGESAETPILIETLLDEGIASLPQSCRMRRHNLRRINRCQHRVWSLLLRPRHRLL
jgi:DNA-binding winged helix-turn-helix (wHTH) protein